jgi:hypothetical protein
MTPTSPRAPTSPMSPTSSTMPDLTNPACIARRVRRGAGMASIVRALCGGAVGARRRGSTIVLVVSSLALFAMITVAYVGLGIGDRRTGSVAVASDQVDDVAVKVRDYLVDVIGRDAIAVLVEDGVGRSADPLIVREAWDYPWTDPNRVSDSRASLPGGQAAIRFDPAGTMPGEMVARTRGGGAQSRPSVFAASDPWLASTEPTWFPDPGLTSPPWASDPPYYKHVFNGWWQISNFAPDGRFVNLFSLRGNFDAMPGIRTGEMSEHLGLLDEDGQAQGGKHTTIHDVRADKFIPAHWTMFQEGAARPVGPGLNASGRFLNPGEPGYAPYSWVDADGDGILDSRWFELVDAYNASQPEGIVSLLPRDNRWRWFVAARAIDLSSLVNINTARDVSSGGAPTANQPIGMTPADIDAQRLFTMEDEFALTYGLPADEQGYSAIHRPLGGVLADYFDYNDDNGFADADGTGQKAYQAMVEGAMTGLVPPLGEFDLQQPMSATDRQEHYLRSGAANPGGARWQPTGGGGSLVNGAAFGIQDLVELLTYHGLNDSTTISRLERMAGGRDILQRQQFSPLRDNRPAEIERLADVGPNPASPSPDGRLDPERLALLAMDPRRRLTTISGATQRRSSNVPYSGAGDVPRAIADVHGDAAPARRHARSVLDLASQPGAADPDPLFQVYAGALLPGELAELIAGGLDPWSDDRYRTMFYGHDPIFALRAAAHLTANRIDSWDEVEGTPETPTAVTLLLNGDGRAAVTGNPDDFPWRLLDLEPDPAVETLPRGSAPDAVNVYGVEAQPFLVQAASFIMYSDQHEIDGGDAEWEQDPIAMQGEVTIEGDVSTTNDDFIFQVVAFQLTNPFEEALSLEDYSVEFGGRDYELNKEEDGTPVTIPAGETVLVYYLSQEKSAIADRMEEAAYQPSGSITFSEELVTDWIEYQFEGVGLGGSGGGGEGDVTVIELQRLQPSLGGIGDVDLLAGSPGLSDAVANRVVLLWRTLDTPAGGQHEMLVDRLRDPAPATARPTLDQRLDTGETKVSGTLVTPPPSIDDEGMSITLWGSVRRPEDPKADSTVPDALPRGGLPAWCIESRFGSGRGGELNIAETGAKPESLSRADFVAETTSEPDPTFQPQGEQKLESLLADQTGRLGGTPQRLVPTLPLEPEQKQTTGKSWSLSTTDQEDQLQYWSGAGADGVDPQLHVGPQRDRALRLGDMLMAMAVGPVEDPQDPRYLETVGLSAERPDEKWTTLAESLALALGYDELESVATSEGEPPLTIAGPTPYLWYKTDRGHLRLHDFTPFYDGDSDGVYDPTAGSSDVLRGDGIPMALSILDAFRPSLGAGDSEQNGSLTNAAVGVININTAPLSVLRTLGILSPTASGFLTRGTGRGWLPSGSPHDEQSDIAATLMAYRDKTLVYPRELSSAAGNPLSFISSGALGPASRGAADPEDIDGRAEHVHNDRYQDPSRGPLPVREQPGFRSLGEIMLARDTAFSGGPGLGGSSGYPAAHDIDRLGLVEAMTAPGVESFLYGDPLQPDALARDYDEKLAIFNSVAGSISVRSDLYAVWFVLHGYQREDVEGLTDQDPLIPTVAKRFLIIVDRSNVTTEGERPRILHFQELPL